MLIPIVTFKTVEGFSASLVGLKYAFTAYPSYEELKKEFATGIKRAIECLKEEGEEVPSPEEVKKELIEEIEIQDLEDIYRIEFVTA